MPKTVEEQVEELGGEKKVVQLGFPAEKLSYLTAENQLKLLKGEIDLPTAKDWAGI